MNIKSRLPFSWQSMVAFAHDVAMASLSLVLALWLRLGSKATDYYPLSELVQAAGVFTVVAATVFLGMGLYRGVWRYASINDLVAITKAVTLAILVFALVQFLWTRLEGLPRSIPIINWFILMALLGGPRFLYRIFKDRRLDAILNDTGRPRVPVLLVGAGDGTELFLRALNRPGDANYEAVGILAVSPGRVGRRIHDIEVMGTLDDLDAVITKLGKAHHAPQRLILTKDDMNGAEVRSLFDQASRLGLTLSRVPRLTDFQSSDGGSIPLREIAVEDLLGRPQKPLDRNAMRAMVAGRRVLITGAGGSIGSELARQIANFAPAELVLLENSEYALYGIDMEIGHIHIDMVRRAVICDVRDRDTLNGVFNRVRPEIVFHAAALKHVPLVEANPAEGLRTNVIGTANVADAAVAHDVQTMVMISTDKAVNPTNIMGASKRVAEQYIQALDLDRSDRDGTRFVTVRFGNVLGSTGSVVPLFRRQLADGGPLTVTHPDMTRYFMTIHEAVELVLQAAAYDGITGHENDGKIYVLDMGEPVKIIDLARQMIRLSGQEPDKDVQIDIVGIRPGEKLFEEVFHGSEPPVTTDSPGILLATPRTVDLQAMRSALQDLDAACRADDEDALGALLRKQVPEYEKTDT